MPKRIVLCLLACSCFAFADEEKSQSKVVLRARLGQFLDSGNSAKIYVYSPEKLNKAEIRFDTVKEFSPLSANVEQAGLFPYGTTSYYPAANGKKYLVRGWRTDGSRFTQLLTLTQDEKKEWSVIVTAYSEESKEKVAADAAAAKKVEQAGDPLFQQINDYRASRGLNRLIWDPGLCIADDAAHSRFKSGQIGASATNWAGATGSAAFNMWLGSPGHHANMLAGGTYGGIGYSGGTATFNVR